MKPLADELEAMLLHDLLIWDKAMNSKQFWSLLPNRLRYSGKRFRTFTYEGRLYIVRVK